MATRSRIAILNEDGTVTSVYCHNDGYFTGVGKCLFNHYKDPEKVKSLIELGGLSFVGKEVGKNKNDFNNPDYDVTCAYHRDRNEDLNQETHESIRDFFSGDFEEYGYLFDGKKWLAAKYTDRTILELSELV